MGRPDVAQKLIRRVRAFQGTGALGGFYGGRKEAAAGKGVFCFDTSGAAIHACLWTGELEAARRGGEYLLALARVSDGAGRWYWAIDSEGNAVDSLAHPSWALNQAPPAASGWPPMNDRRWCYMDRATPGQAHWKTGFYLANCAYLYRAFGDRRYLAAALRCARFALGTADARATPPWPMWGHKAAWGAAELYRVTGSPALRAMARALGAMLARRQDKGVGFWRYEEWWGADINQRHPSAVYSIAAQAVTWMGKVKEALGYTPPANAELDAWVSAVLTGEPPPPQEEEEEDDEEGQAAKRQRTS